MYMFAHDLQNQNSPIDSPTARKHWPINHQPITKNMEAHFCQYHENNILKGHYLIFKLNRATEAFNYCSDTDIAATQTVEMSFMWI